MSNFDLKHFQWNKIMVNLPIFYYIYIYYFFFSGPAPFLSVKDQSTPVSWNDCVQAFTYE